MKKNRIDQKFIDLKQQRRKAFIAYVTAGDPSLVKTHDIILGLEKAGVDIIEIGIPFSDPLADGGTIQAASKRALDHGVTLAQIFDMVKRLRQKTKLPLLFMTYYNPIFHYGEERFIKMCQDIGIDGLIIPDLPPEEATDLRKLCRGLNIATVFFVAPTTENERLKNNALASTGFIYYVALTGVTGNAHAQATLVNKAIQHAKKFTKKPICAGFGISTPDQIRAIAKVADGVIVGSAIVSKIALHAKDHDLIHKITTYVRTLTKAIH